MNADTSIQLFWKKKTIVSYFLSILIFMIHISSFAQYDSSGGTVSLVNDKLSFFFSESITRFAVPMFFILSGIAFFRNYDNSKYFNKLKSRFFSLVIPYLVWNTIWVIFEMVCTYSFISSFYTQREMFELTPTNILSGIFLHKYCLPFWFVFNLIFFTVISPIIYAVIKNKYVGLTVTFILSVLLIFDIGLPISLFSSQSSIVYFIFGAIIGKHYFTYLQEKSSVSMRIVSAVFLLTVIVLKNIFPTSTYTIKPFISVVVHIFCAISLWCLFDAFIDKMKERPLYSRSFLVYAMHVNIAAIITKLTMFVLPKNEAYAILNFAITLVATLVFINLFCIVIERYFPSVYFILSGKKPKSFKKS